MFLIFVGLLEIIAYGVLIKSYWFAFEAAAANNQKIVDLFKVEHFDKKNYNKYFRTPTIKKDSKKGDILVFGCSYAEGHGLKNEETFEYKLANYTNRTVYNRGLGGQGPQLMLYQLRDPNFKNVVPNADYIIYIFIEDHFNRLYKHRNWPFLNLVSVKYDLVGDKLIENELNYPWGYSAIIRFYEEQRTNNYSQEEKEELLLKILEESHKKSKELYPNSKFFILNYPQGVFITDKTSPVRHQYMFSENFKTGINKIGIKTINADELTSGKIIDKKYQISGYDDHPNSQAWDLIVPLIAKKINL